MHCTYIRRKNETFLHVSRSTVHTVVYRINAILYGKRKTKKKELAIVYTCVNPAGSCGRLGFICEDGERGKARREGIYALYRLKGYMRAYCTRISLRIMGTKGLLRRYLSVCCDMTIIDFKIVIYCVFIEKSVHTDFLFVTSALCHSPSLHSSNFSNKHEEKKNTR